MAMWRLEVQDLALRLIPLALSKDLKRLHFAQQEI